MLFIKVIQTNNNVIQNIGNMNEDNVKDHTMDIKLDIFMLLFLLTFWKIILMLADINNSSFSSTNLSQKVKWLHIDFFATCRGKL